VYTQNGKKVQTFPLKCGEKKNGKSIISEQTTKDRQYWEKKENYEYVRRQSNHVE
jgi:hypothetical protein